jgi:two-component system sensor histidine kinase CiaH
MFQSARFKLTAWYLLIIMSISGAFSVVIYRMLDLELDRFARIQQFRIERRYHTGGGGEFFIPQTLDGLPPISIKDIEIVNDFRHRLVWTLLVINGAIAVISSGLGYVLAGRTLRPIARMVDEQHRFVADASHEFRTPLTSLKSSMEVSMRDRHMTLKDAKKLIAENLQDVDRLQILSDRLLRLAQGSQGQSVQRFVSTPIKDVITKSVRAIDRFAKNKSIEVITDYEDVRIECDPDALIECCTLLLENAVKYSSDKTTVTVTAKKMDHHLKIQVIDHGVGIAKKDLLHVFDRFYRADSARCSGSASGYGLGLSIAKTIVQSHHGTIGVESTLNVGSIFTVLVPLKQKHA